MGFAEVGEGGQVPLGWGSPLPATGRPQVGAVRSTLVSPGLLLWPGP